MQLFVTIVLFQAGWFSCVLGAAYDQSWLGPLVVGFLAILRLMQCDDRPGELRLIVAVGLLGTVLDSLQSVLGLLRFEANPFAPWLVPPWLSFMWVNFALALRTSMAWLREREGLAALLGAIGGPAAYYAGARLGALDFPLGLWPAGIGVGLVWGIGLPAMIHLAFRRDTNA